MYALGGNFRTWVCAIDAKGSSVALRFLYGVLLDDPRRVGDPVEGEVPGLENGGTGAQHTPAVGAYVSEAVVRYDEYKANTAKVLHASRAAARRKKPKAAK
jgi:hypothetical protein